MGLVFWIAIGVMAIPDLSGVALNLTGPIATPIGSPSAHHVTAGSHLPSGPSASSVSTSASNGFLPSVPSTSSHLAFQSEINIYERSRQAWAERNASAAANATAAQARAHPDLTIPTGKFSGYVYNSLTGAAVQGVTVEAYSVGAAICPATTCAPVSSNSAGAYTVVCPVGADFVQYSESFYLTNVTYSSCSNGLDTNLSAVYLVPEATVTGLVESDSGSHQKVAGVSVQSISRDGTVTGNPAGTSNTNGVFSVAVPPLPSKILFSPPPGYLGNFTYVNATPGATINIGTIYLSHLTQIRIKVFDRLQRGSGGLYNVPVSGSYAAISVCSAVSGACLAQSPTVGTPSVISSLAFTGEDYVHVQVQNYLENITMIGPVPELAAGQSWPSGSPGYIPVFVVPMSSFNLDIGVSHPTSDSSYPHWSLGTSCYAGPNCFYSVSISSLDGYSMGVVIQTNTGLNMTVTGTINGCAATIGLLTGVTAFPLRNVVSTAPDYSGMCSNGYPYWPIPGLAPVWGNNTWISMLPGQSATGRVFLNFTYGDYVYGNIYVHDKTGKLIGPPNGFTISVFSTEYPTLIQYPYTYPNPRAGYYGPSNWACTQQTQGASNFCVAAPPGDFQIKATAPGYLDNWTWGWGPSLCCNKLLEPAQLQAVTNQHLQDINLSTEGAVYGHVFGGGTSLGVAFGSVQVCPAASTSPFACTYTVVYAGGNFYAAAPIGWDYVTASASGYSQNTAWVDVASLGANVSAGNLTLTPLATLTGRVVGPNGAPVFQANIHYCTVSKTPTCALGGGKTLGAGQTETDGVYNGTVPGGWLPWTTYAVVVTASGYSTDWAWVNATPGQTSVVPTMTILPVGTNSSAAPVGQHPSAGGGGGSTGSGAAGVWVNGRVVDASTGRGVWAASVEADTLDGLNRYQFSDGTNTGGFFNSSVPPGLYNVNVSATGYLAASMFINASAAGVVNMPTIELQPLGWVTGQVVINDFGANGVPLNLTQKDGLGPGVGFGAQACSSSGAGCSGALPVNLGGFFNVSSVSGNLRTIRISPNAFGGGGGSAAGGYLANHTTYNSTGNSTVIANPIPLDLFGTVQGSVYDGKDLSGAGALYLPARWTTVTVGTRGVKGSVTVPVVANGGGQYEVFLPAGNGHNRTLVTAFTPSAYAPNLSYLQPNLTIGQTLFAPLLNLTHFGYAELRIVDSVTGQGIPYMPGSATYTNYRTGESVSSNGPIDVANYDGYLNMTAPAGAKISFAFGALDDYNNTTVIASVNSSQTTHLNSTTGTYLGNVSLGAWGWVSSLNVSNQSFALSTLYDPAVGQPLPGAGVTVSSTEPGLQGASQPSNWLGQFLSDAPIGPKDSVVFTHDAYLSNRSILPIAAGSHTVFNRVNLTGFGVVAAKVVSYPGNVPVAGAQVRICPPRSTVCGLSVTNVSGLFWAAAPPGTDTITVDADGFVENATTTVALCADCFSELGPITLSLYAYVFGSVRGLPSGFVVSGATVSLCSPLGSPVGPCGFSITTTGTGNFVLPAAAGQYILQANDTNYNSSYLPLSLRPGEHLPVGTIFLQQFGYIIGTVYSETTVTPVINATVLACPVWSGASCAPPTHTDPSGHFTVGGPPGGLLLTVSAAGFNDGYVTLQVKSGATTLAKPIFLVPLGTNILYPVQGRVISAADTSVAIANALVAADVNGTPAYSTVTQASGSFLLNVAWGDYNLTAGAQGYRTAERTLTVHAAYSGLTFALSPMTFSVSGVVTDGLTHTPLGGVALDLNDTSGTVLAVTDTNGFFTFELANGSYTMVANPGGSLYAAVAVAFTVNGQSVTRENVQLLPPTTVIYGEVVDAATGLSLAGAPVTLKGVATDSVPIARSATSDAGGGFQLAVPAGSYTITASLSGYATVTESFQAVSSAAPLVVPLKPVPQSSGTSAASMSANLEYGAAIALGAVAVGLVLFTVTRKPPARKASGKAPATKQ